MSGEELTDGLIAELKSMRQPASMGDLHKIVRILLYGDPGIGKTTLAALIAEVLGGKVLIITTDANWVVINDLPVAERVDQVAFDAFSQVRTIVRAHDAGIEPFSEYKTCIWDTVSTATLNMTRTIVKNKNFNDRRDPDAAGWTDYYMATEGLRETLDVINKSDMNFIYNTHLKNYENEIAVRSNINSAAYDALAQGVQAIGFVHKEKKGDTVKVQFEPTNRNQAKSQISTIQQTTYESSQIPELIRKWVMQ